MHRIFFFGYFRDLVKSERNAPLASESLGLYIKELLDANFVNENYSVDYVNLANSKKAFCIERNINKDNLHQIGTVCFGKTYRKIIWSKSYWKKIYRFCKKNVTKDDVLIFYHSLYTNHLFKKIKDSINCKIILVGAELYSDVSNNAKDRRLELESYAYSNAHILISDVLKDEIRINRPSIIMSGDYRERSFKEPKFSLEDHKIHLVYAGTFNPTKGGAALAIESFNYLDNQYVLHILGFGDRKPLDDLIAKNKNKDNIIFDGLKTGDDLLKFLSKCDIGLSSQIVSSQFNNSSFPSKIITYSKCGLSVVSTPSVSVTRSPFKDIVSLSNSDNPKDIAEAIKNLKGKHNQEQFFKTIRDSFSKQFIELVKNTFECKNYLIANSYYGGSTGNIARAIQKKALEEGNNCHFFYLIDKKKKEPYVKRYGCHFEHYLSPLLTRFTGNCLGYMLSSTNSLKKYTKKLQPDLVNLHCMNSYSLNISKYLRFIKKTGLKTVVTNHAFFYSTGSCGYPFGECKKYLTGCGKCPNKRYACKSYFIDRTKKNWKTMFKAFENSNIQMTSVSDYVRFVCLESPITKQLVNKTILNGIDTSIFNYKNEKFNDDKVHILYVASAIKNSNKGFPQFIKVVESLKNNGKFAFHVVGEHLSLMDKYQNIVSHGMIKDKNELATLYSKCDLTLVTSRRETFYLPVVESLCSGTPVAGYKCGGPESFVEDKESAVFFDFDDVDSLVNYIKSDKYRDVNKLQLASKNISIFSNVSMSENYLQLFKQIVNNSQK